MIRIEHLLNPEQTGKSIETRTPSKPLHPQKHLSSPPPPLPPPYMDLSRPAHSTNLTASLDNRVNFRPYAILSNRNGAVSSDLIELARYHDRFRVSLCEGKTGNIQDNARRVPYSSEKRGFMLRTGRDALQVYEYDFRVAGDATLHHVKWDYENGLTRITPFFKACEYSKVIPKKALDANALLGLSINVTGGSVKCQGYYTPYACARALCITFCYPIRWALTPIFGPTFVDECLRPDHPGFAKFKIDPQLVQDAALEAEQWRNTAAQTELHGKTGQGTAKKKSTKQPRGRKKSLTRSTVPVSYDEDLSYGSDSPPVSPKTIPQESTRVVESNGWTTINKPGDSVTSKVSPMSPDHVSITPLILPAPIVFPPAAVVKALQRSTKSNKRKAKKAPTSDPSDTSWADERDDLDDGFYGAVENYIIRSPPSPVLSSTPPPKRAKRSTSRPSDAEKQVQGYESSTEADPRALSTTEMDAVEGLLQLFKTDEEATQHHVHS